MRAYASGRLDALIHVKIFAAIELNCRIVDAFERQEPHASNAVVRSGGGERRVQQPPRESAPTASRVHEEERQIQHIRRRSASVLFQASRSDDLALRAAATK